MKKLALLAPAVLAATLLAAPVNALAEEEEFQGTWKQDSKGWWYQYGEEADDYYKDQVAEIDGKCYYFGEDGYLGTGWFIDADDCWRLADSNGVLQEGWIGSDATGWYYLYPAKETDGDYSWFNYEGGRMATGTWIDDTYYMGSDGLLASNKVAYYWDDHYDEEAGEWVYESGNYYIGADGKADTTPGWKLVTSYYNDELPKWTYVGQDGKILESYEWFQDGGSWYYMGYNTIYQNQTVTEYEYDEDGNYKYDEDGNKIKHKYYLTSSGAMLTGWYDRTKAGNVTQSWMYADDNGELYDGWLGSDATGWYYIDEGYMKASTTYSIYDENTRESTRYYFLPDGKLLYGWYHDTYTDNTGYVSDSWIYTNPTTGVMETTWVQSGGKWYYISDGYMQRACTVNDSELYYDSKWDAEEEEWVYTYADSYPQRENYGNYVEYQRAQDDFQAKHTYVMNPDGTLSTGGWVASSSNKGTTWYYANADGTGANGWIADGGNWYYFLYGRMLYNQYTPDGYWVNAAGVCQ